MAPQNPDNGATEPLLNGHPRSGSADGAPVSATCPIVAAFASAFINFNIVCCVRMQTGMPLSPCLRSVIRDASIDAVPLCCALPWPSPELGSVQTAPQRMLLRGVARYIWPDTFSLQVRTS